MKGIKIMFNLQIIITDRTGTIMDSKTAEMNYKTENSDMKTQEGNQTTTKTIGMKT